MGLFDYIIYNIYILLSIPISFLLGKGPLALYEKNDVKYVGIPLDWIEALYFLWYVVILVLAIIGVFSLYKWYRKRGDT